MKVIYILAAPLVTLSIARADGDPFENVRTPLYGEDWPACVLGLDDAAHKGVAGSTPFGKLERPAGDLAAGNNPTADALRAECVKQANKVPDTDKRWRDSLGSMVGPMRTFVKEMKENPYDHTYRTLLQEVRLCHAWIDVAIEVRGPDYQVKLPDRSFGDWTGTTSAAKKELCGFAEAAANEQKKKKLEPYLKAGIKNDKLKILDDYDVSVEIGIPGGTFTLDAGPLAKANPWFSASTGDDCAGGKITHLHRYEFDKNQKLVSETTKDYCGAVPKGAYR
jgi:hypothetical protein